MSFPNAQSNPAGAIPVRLVTEDGSAFYTATGGGGGGAPYNATPKGYEQITDLSTAVSLTVPAGATFAIIEATGGDCRWRDDGVAPTGSVGMPFYSGLNQQFAGDISALQFIQQNDAAPAVLNVSYYA